MDQRTARLGNERIGKLLWSFSLPAIAGMVVGSLYTVIDRAFLGNVVGADAIAGISLSMPIGFLMMAFGTLLGVGSGTLISIRLGQKRKGQAELILGNTVTLIIVMSFVLTVIFFVALDPLFVAFGASPKTLPYARQFMQVILLGCVFQYLVYGLNPIIRAEGNPRLAMMTLLINAGLNVLLDALFIWILGFGIRGAAVATVLSQAVSAGWTVLHFLGRRSVLRLQAANLRLRWTVIQPSLAIGLTPFSMHIAMSVVSLLMNRNLARLGGDTAVGAYGVIGALVMLILMPMLGLAQGAQPIIGFNYGARLSDRTTRTLKLAIIAATVVACLGFLLAELFPGPLMSIFSEDQELVAIGRRGMRIAFLGLPLVGFGIISGIFFQAIGRARIALLLTLSRQVLVLIPLLLVLPRYWGLDGLWAAGAISDVVSGLFTGVALTYQLRSMARQTDRPIVEMPSSADPVVAS